MPDRDRIIFILGDLGAFVAFGAIGMASHEDGVTLKTIARAVLLFLAAWLLIAPWFGAFSQSAVAGRVSLLRIVLVWLLAGVIALVARAAIFDRALFNAFFIVALVGYGAFLVGWRAIYGRWLAPSPRGATG